MLTRESITPPPDTFEHPALQLWATHVENGQEYGMAVVIHGGTIDAALFDIVALAEQDMAEKIAAQVGRPGVAALVTCEWGWINLEPIEEAGDAAE